MVVVPKKVQTLAQHLNQLLVMSLMLLQHKEALEGDFLKLQKKYLQCAKQFKAIVNSKHTAPHVTLMDEIDVQKLWDHRKKFKEIAAEQGTKLTFLPYVVKALVSA